MFYFTLHDVLNGSCGIRHIFHMLVFQKYINCVFYDQMNTLIMVSSENTANKYFSASF